MHKVLTYKEQVWANAVREAEGDVMRHCPTLPGGRLATETVEQYANRCWVALQGYLERLRDARDALAELQPKTTMTKTTSKRY